MTSDTNARFEVCRIPELPRLAWCVKVEQGDAVARLLCGDRVENHVNWFSAGAWNGNYATGCADEAEIMCGSAGRCVAEGFIFAAPGYTMEWIHFVRHDSRLTVSNSLPFILAELDDAPDPTYADYFFDVLETYRAGLSKPGRALPTAGGRKIEPVLAGNLKVGLDLSTCLTRKPEPPAPQNFEDYLAFLQRTAEQLVENAQSSFRAHRYAPVVTVSRGYDSVAAASVAKHAGCKLAVTLKDKVQKEGVDSDNGKPVAQALGMEVKQYDRQVANVVEKCDDWEFCIKPKAGTDKNFMVFSDELAGRLFITGRRGETHWSFQRGSCHPMFQEPDAMLLSGTTLIEPSLRLGFIHFPLPTAGAIHAPLLAEISRSDAMKPWRIGGEYDRPIPRRIAEEEGVARHLFGMKKHGGPDLSGEERMSTQSYTDLQRFFDEMKPLMPPADPLTGWIPRRIKRRLNQAVLWLRAGSHWQQQLAALVGNRFHPAWRTADAYSIHWAWIRTSERYKAALRSNGSYV